MHRLAFLVGQCGKETVKLEGVTLRACCLNCRHYDKDERTATRYSLRRIPGPPPVFCPDKGIKEEICGKFLPRKADVLNAIWRAREKANKGLSTKDCDEAH